MSVDTRIPKLRFRIRSITWCFCIIKDLRAISQDQSLRERGFWSIWWWYPAKAVCWTQLLKGTAHWLRPTELIKKYSKYPLMDDVKLKKVFLITLISSFYKPKQCFFGNAVCISIVDCIFQVEEKWSKLNSLKIFKRFLNEGKHIGMKR